MSPPDAGIVGDDGGVTEASFAIVPQTNYSHYSWSQGCGCSSGGDPLGLVVLTLLVASRLRRRALLPFLLGSLLVACGAEPSAEPPPLENDGGVSQASRGFAPSAPSHFSHYSWAQGCGCSSTGDPLGVVVLALVLLARNRRLFAVLGLMTAILLAPPAAAAERLRLTFPGVNAGAGVTKEEAAGVGEFLQTQLVARGLYKVSGPGDLSEERRDELLRCDATCKVELPNADRLLTSSLSKSEDGWELSMALSDAKTSQPLFRVSRRARGSLDQLLDQIDPMLAELTRHDGASTPGSPVEAAVTNQWTVGVRAEFEAIGLIDRQPAVAPALFASWGRGFWGAAVAVIILPIVGVRAEGRLHFLERSVVRPYLGAGATLFGFAFAPRGAVGVTTDLGPVRLSVDAAIEYYVSGPYRFEPLALLWSLGAAWRF